MTKTSVVVVNKDGKDDLQDCLPSLLAQTAEDYEVIVVDNNSDDGSVEYVTEEHPEVRLVVNDANEWYAGGNNIGFAAAKGEFIAVLNPDVVVEEDWLECLVAPLTDGQAEITTSKVLYYEDPKKVNTCGNLAHYTGLGFCRGLDCQSSAYTEEEVVPSVSGCAFVITRELLDEIGGFDEDFEFYYEDLDLAWRARLAGRDVLFVPSSVVYHKYDRPLPPWRFYNMERNRYLILLKHLQVRTLILLLPSLLLTELLLWGVAALKGFSHVLAKLRAQYWVMNNLGAIQRKRAAVQRLRKRDDAELIGDATPLIPLARFGVPEPLATWLSTLLKALYSIPYVIILKYYDSTKNSGTRGRL
ncbi:MULTISPECIES: glycosyltransferase family 2 protein [Halorussus]|uniref:glycosyltransferase family 2 protein n=1 Tax=Halorussus TaxID=1070314 RepID=UPI00209DD5FA|nr:glycosyltransferase family 2 protein [Halorussus vallis]USZ77386.1 glycosyltransferase family 2 protein [Halorussus vallis]